MWSGWQIHDNRCAGEELLNFTQLFVARILSGNDHLAEAENILYVAKIGRLGERALEHWIVDGKELLQHAALLRLQTWKRFVRFRVHADVAFQIRGANRASIENALRPEQRNFHVFRAILAEGIYGEQQHIGIKLFGAAPHEAEAAHGLVASERVAGRSLYVLHVSAENRGEKSGQELRHGADQILLVTNHVRGNLRRSRL